MQHRTQESLRIKTYNEKKVLVAIPLVVASTGPFGTVAVGKIAILLIELGKLGAPEGSKGFVKSLKR
jgi:hypothetical protein